MREFWLGALEHQDVPFERLVEDLAPDRSLARHPLFQVLVTVQNNTRPATELPGLQVAAVPGGIGTARYDLDITLAEARGGDGTTGLRGRLLAAADLFDEATAQAIAGRLGRVLAAVAVAPDTPLHAVRVLGDGERAQVVEGWNDTAAPVPAAMVPELFEAQAARTPDAVAVVCGKVQLSYAELNRRANRLARLLVARGAGPEQVVAVLLDRSVGLVVAVLAVLKTGAAYLPVDPGYPVARIEYMLGDARPRCVLTASGLAPGLGEACQVPVLAVDDPALAAALPGPAADLGQQERTASLSAASPAYVIYAPGSAGTPNAVAVPHGGVVNLAAALAPALGAGPGRRVLQLASFGPDAWVLDVVVTLAAGGVLVIASAADRVDPDRLAVLARRAGVGSASVAPSLLQVLDAGALPGVSRLVAAWEPVTARLAATWAPGRVLTHGYGPAEATVIVATAVLDGDRDSQPPIGAPVANTRVYVLDRSGPGAGRGNRGAACGRCPAGPRLPGPGGADRAAVCRVPGRRAGGADVPDRGPGPVDHWRAADVRRAGR